MRRFLLLTVLVSCALHQGSSTSVVIVGAGAAGIAAATKLLDNGIANITILEAENRIGGRIHSVKFGDAFVDLGAEFCHGQKGNVVYDLVKELNILEPVDMKTPIIFYYSNSTRINAELGAELQTFTFTYEDGDEDRSALSLGEFFLKQYNQTLLQRYRDDPQKLTFFKDGVTFGESATEINEGCFSWFEPSAESHYEECEGNQALTWGGYGYKTILEVLMKSYSNGSNKLEIDDKTLLDKEVTKIDYENSKVTVVCSNNTIVKADHVIFTPSIGVLKATHKDVFKPRLPEAKQRAIEELGFGGVMKIVMHFPQGWWKNEDAIISFIWSDTDLKNLRKEFPEIDWISNIRILFSSSKNPNVRIAWLSGKQVKDVEQLPLKSLKNGLVYLLNKFLSKDYNVSEPDQIIRTAWCSNPHFRGSYSFERVEFYKKEVSNQNILAEPLVDGAGRPSVLFAGEATNPVHYSTVHGAVESGHREAERIIRLHKGSSNTL